jgi:ribosomal protein S18 acetylase RimI-like enzyme
MMDSNMLNLSLRDATLDDASLMTDLIRTAFEDQRGKIDPPSGAHNDTPEKVRAKLQQGGGILAYVDGEVAGCVVYYPEGEHHLYLGRLAVLPAFRQHGVGHALVAAVEAKAKQQGYTGISLSVRIPLPRNQAFFERLGYSITSYASHPGYTEPTFMHMLKPLP